MYDGVVAAAEKVYEGVHKDPREERVERGHRHAAPDGERGGAPGTFSVMRAEKTRYNARAADSEEV